MQVRCAKCAAAIPLERDDAFLRCPYCDSTLFLDRAATFLRFDLPAALSERRARDLLAQALEAREIAARPSGKVERLRLPFWAVRGAEATSTLPAFSPLPPGFGSYRLPAARGALSAEGDDGGFRAVESSETASARWEESGAPEGLGLYFVPFYRLDYGTDAAPYEAWVDAAAGTVLLGQTPPSDTEAISKRSMTALAILLAVCALETALIPNPALGLLAVALTGAAAVPILKRQWRPPEAP